MPPSWSLVEGCVQRGCRPRWSRPGTSLHRKGKALTKPASSGRSSEPQKPQMICKRKSGSCRCPAWPRLRTVDSGSGPKNEDVLLGEAQLPAERLSAGVAAEADLRMVEKRRRATRVERREPFESFQRAILVAQESVDLGLALREWGELRGECGGE